MYSNIKVMRYLLSMCDIRGSAEDAVIQNNIFLSNIRMDLRFLLDYP